LAQTADILDMGGRIRVWEPGIVYSGAQRCNDRTFLFKPNHRLDNPLLHQSCPAAALDPLSDIVPLPSTINLIGSSLARAHEQHPVDITWWEVSINHQHPGLLPREDQLDDIAPFLRHANSLIARGINKLHDHEGRVFSGPVRFTPCIDDASAERQLLYALANPVKDGLVDRVRRSPFFSTFRAQARGEPLRYWFIDWEAWWAAGGRRKKGNRPKDFLKWIELPITPLPEFADWPEHRIQSRIRHAVRDIEEETRERLRQEERAVVGVPALFEVDPRDRPADPKTSGPQPICHAADQQLRREYVAHWREIVSEHRRASWDYRMGFHEREFPDGTYRPPVTTIYNSSHL
jgi:hypothetical protein